MVRRMWLNCILALGLTVSLTACSQPPAQPDLSPPADAPILSGPVESRPLTLAIYENQSLHPILGSDRVNLTLAPLLYEGLFELDPSFTPQPQLCEQFSCDKNGLVWTFTLRRDVTFSDGTPLTAAHAAHSLDLARSAASRFAGRFSCVSSVSAKGDHDLIITLSRPNNALPTLLDVPIVSDSGGQPLGTGPYVLAREEGAFCLVPRSGTEATIPLISVSRTRELTTAFERGDLSLICTDPSATDSPGFSGAHTSVDHDTTALIYLGFNTTRSPFGSAPARRAVADTLDRNALVSAAWSGHARATAFPFHPASPLYDEALARPNTADQPTTAPALSGRRATLIVNTENSSRVSAAHLIARQLESTGLSVTVSALPWADYLSALSNGQFDLYLSEVALTADFDLTALLSSAGGLNYGRWISAQADTLLTDFLALPEGERPQTASRLCTLLAEQTPIAPLCFKRGSVLTTWDRADELTPTRANPFFGLL